VLSKTILLVDDDQWFLEPLVDGLVHEGYRVLTARTVENALITLSRESVDLVTIDIMIDPGDILHETVDTHSAGMYLCREVRNRYPKMEAFCISVINDPATIRDIKKLGIRFLGKGETPLRTVLNMIKSRLTGTAYSGDRNKR
jgi:ActR/RegA family two-component response regulator